MFKQFVIIFTLIVIIIITYYSIRYILIKTHKLYLNNDTVKYILYDSDREYLNKYSKDTDIFELKNEKNPVFYTDVKWSTKKNNYIKFKERYYIIEPGYYYYITPDAELFLHTSIKIKLNEN
jgi:hypothetical protein